MTAVENKIADVNSLVKKKMDDDVKILDTENKVTNHNHDEYIKTSEFDKLTAKSFAARLAEANLVTKTDFDAKLKIVNKNINSNKTKHLLVENESRK